jgi:hypothetical protein
MIIGGGRGVVEDPGGQADGRIRQSIERLRPRRHHGGVGEMLGAKILHPVEGVLFVGRETGGRLTTLQRLGDLRRNRAGEVGVNAQQFRWPVQPSHWK